MTTKVSVYTFYCKFLNDCMSTKNNKVTYFMTFFVFTYTAKDNDYSGKSIGIAFSMFYI